MTEEEKKAIELIQEELIRLDKIRTSPTGTYILLSQLETVLNLVKKQQEEIEKLKWKNEIYVKSIKSHKRELEKKDKVMDIMATKINELDPLEIYCGAKTECVEHCEDCIKQYFENKVEGSK